MKISKTILLSVALLTLGTTAITANTNVLADDSNSNVPATTYEVTYNVVDKDTNANLYSFVRTQTTQGYDYYHAGKEITPSVLSVLPKGYYFDDYNENSATSVTLYYKMRPATPDTTTDTSTTPEVKPENPSTPGSTTDASTTPEVKPENPSTPGSTTDASTTPEVKPENPSTPGSTTDASTTPEVKSENPSTPSSTTKTDAASGTKVDTSKVSVAKTPKNGKYTTNTLPNTGEKGSFIMPILGFVSLVSGFVYYKFKTIKQ